MGISNPNPQIKAINADPAGLISCVIEESSNNITWIDYPCIGQFLVDLKIDWYSHFLRKTPNL